MYPDSNNLAKSLVFQERRGGSKQNLSSRQGKIMRIVCLLSAIFQLWAWAAGPSADIRNIEMADYKTHFHVPEYKSRQEWEDHKVHLRQQILSAAGLTPLPSKTPLHPRVIRTFEYEDYSIQVVLVESLPGYYLGGNL